jgi:hypothetical protein
VWSFIAGIPPKVAFVLLYSISPEDQVGIFWNCAAGCFRKNGSLPSIPAKAAFHGESFKDPNATSVG